MLSYSIGCLCNFQGAVEILIFFILVLFQYNHIYIVDRKKDMVIVGGLNVYPREVEEVIYQCPKVKEAAVIGINDSLRGEYVKAVVALKEGMTCSSRELLKFLKEKLANYKLPREIDFVDALPKNSTGKILKRLLKENIGKQG
jgi:long-chain acyl-CoA synthetase